MRSAFALVALVALPWGCFDDVSYLPGYKCSPETECPPEQICVQATNGEARCQYSNPSGHDDCDLLSGTGCGDTEKCTLASQDTPVEVCVLRGDLTEGEACASLGAFDECTSGLLCLYGACRAICDPDTLAGCGSNTCVSFGSYAVCAAACDPLSPQCPMSGVLSQTCYLDSSGASACLPTQDPVPAGGACTNVNQCPSGSSCIESICRSHCDFASTGGQQGTCLAGFTCQQVANNIGVCR